MNFSEYLLSKKIDEEKFKAAEPQKFEEWRLLFEQVSPDSFTMQKKFHINPTRRKYLYCLIEGKG
jgi:hypothetical protein